MDDIVAKVIYPYRLAIVGKIGSCIVFRIDRKRGVLHLIEIRIASDFRIVIRCIIPIDAICHCIGSFALQIQREIRDNTASIHIRRNDNGPDLDRLTILVCKYSRNCGILRD